MPSAESALVVQAALVRRNATGFLVGDTFWLTGIAVVAPTTVLVAFLQSRGAGEGAAGAIGAIDGGTALLQLAGPWLFRSRRRRKRAVLVWYALTALPALAAMAMLVWWADALPSAALAWGMLGAYAVYAVSLGVAVGTWMDWFAHLFDARVRGRVAGVCKFGAAAAGVLGGAAAGWALSALEPATAYRALFLSAVALCGVSLLAYAAVRDPARDDAVDVAPPRGRALLALIAASLRDRTVRALLAARVLGNAALATAPFLALLYMRDRGLDASTVVSCAIAQSVTAAVAAYVCGRRGDLRGHRDSLAIGLALAALASASALVVPGVAGCVGTYALLGLATGAWIAGGYLVHETTPHGSLLAHLLATNLVQAAFGLAVPIAWAALAAGAGVGWMLAASAAAALAGFAWVLLRVPEPRRRAPTPSPGQPAEARRAA